MRSRMKNDPLPIRRPVRHTNQRPAERSQLVRLGAVGAADPEFCGTGSTGDKNNLFTVRRVLGHFVAPRGVKEGIGRGWRRAGRRDGGAPNIRVFHMLGIYEMSAP